MDEVSAKENGSINIGPGIPKRKNASVSTRGQRLYFVTLPFAFGGSDAYVLDSRKGVRYVHCLVRDSVMRRSSVAAGQHEK